MAILLGNRAMNTKKSALLTWLIPLLFLIAYGWYFWLALSNLLGILAYADWAGGQLNLYAWIILLSGLLAPVAVFLVVTIVTWRKALGLTLLVFAMGLSLLAVLWVDMLAIAQLGGTAI